MGTALTDAPDRPDDALHQQRHLHVRRRPGRHRGHAALRRAGARPFAAAHGGRAARPARIRPTSPCKGARRQVSRVLAGKMSLLGFELRQALDRSDTATADGRVRAFEEVRRIMERARRLSRSGRRRSPWWPIGSGCPPTASALLLRGSGPPRGSRRPSRPRARAPRRWPSGCWAARPSSSGTSWWRRPAIPAGPRPFLQALTPEHFSDPSNREVFVGLREAFALARTTATDGPGRRLPGCRRGPTAIRRRAALRAAGHGGRPGALSRWPCSKSCICGCRSSISSARSPRCGADLDEGGDVEEDAAPSVPPGAAAARACGPA